MGACRCKTPCRGITPMTFLLRAASATVVRSLLIWCALSAMAPPAGQGLELNPIMVEIAPGQLSASLKIVNHNASAISFQVRAFGWQQGANDQDTLTPTSELLSSPPLGTIAAGGAQLIRLVLRRPPQGREESYRILFDQLPAPADNGTVRLLVRFSIPVFAEPQARIEPQLEWSVARQQGRYWLVASNTGAQHITLGDLQAFSADGHPLQLSVNAPPHILPAATRRWQIDTSEGLGPGWIRVTAARESIDVRVPLPASP